MNVIIVENYDEMSKLASINIKDVINKKANVILGLGTNGHIAFNEPSDFLISGTHLANLTQSTINANSRFFNSIDEVPKTAITMGLGQIMKSKKILLLAHGENKAEVIKEVLSGKITTKNPATMLQMHKNITIIIDKTIGSLINIL